MINSKTLRLQNIIYFFPVKGKQEPKMGLYSPLDAIIFSASRFTLIDTSIPKELKFSLKRSNFEIMGH